MKSRSLQIEPQIHINLCDGNYCLPEGCKPHKHMAQEQRCKPESYK